jgi:hypothetical protein
MKNKELRMYALVVLVSAVGLYALGDLLSIHAVNVGFAASARNCQIAERLYDDSVKQEAKWCGAMYDANRCAYFQKESVRYNVYIDGQCNVKRCPDSPYRCRLSERATVSWVERCVEGSWSTVETCASGCARGACLESSKKPLVEQPSEAVACRDSDAGIDYAVRGSVHNPGSVIATSTDSCAELVYVPMQAYQDIGTCSGSACYLREYYCEGISTSVRYQPCPNGCRDGACVVALTPVACTDSDGGSNYNVVGTTTGRDNYQGDKTQVATYTDYCQDLDRLAEFVCGYINDATGLGYIYMQGHICPNGCNDGACIAADQQQPSTCADSDGGINYQVKGTVSTTTDPAARFVDICMESGIEGGVQSYRTVARCSGDPCYINENYCDGDTTRATQSRCPSGCTDGVCIS